MERRAFLGGVAASVATLGWHEPASGIGPISELKLARLLYPGSTSSRANALRVMSEELRVQTSIDVSLNTPNLTFKDSFYNYPLLFSICDRPRGGLKTRDGAKLKTWLSSGGTLIMDNVGTNGPSEGFDEQFRADMKSLFPRNPMKKIPGEHVLYRSFYRLDYPAGRRIARSYLEGLEIDGRMAVIYSQNDLTGAWSRDQFGGWEFDVSPGGERQRESAIRMGINAVEYALCQDYKADQVHVNYLLKKRKWKPTRAGHGALFK